MPPDLQILLLIAVVAISGGLILLREAKRYRARRQAAELSAATRRSSRHN